MTGQKPALTTSRNCPILRTALLRIITHCWNAHQVPKAWKHGFTILIYKKGDATDHANFRPITLEPVCAKVFTSFIRNRMYTYLLDNKYIETEIQKGFWSGISGTVEHTELLTCMINHARRYQRDLIVTLLDLRNAFGEVDHQFIQSILTYHYIPQEIKSLVTALYQDYTISIGTKEYVTNPILVRKGVLQGDCLSPLLFNMCFNTLIRCIQDEKIKRIGYSFTDALGPRHWFQFAGDTALATATPEDNQALLNVFSKWFT